MTVQRTIKKSTVKKKAIKKRTTKPKTSRMRTPPFPAHPSWSTARFWGYLRGHLRKAWLRWPPRYLVLNKAMRTVVGKRHKKEYECAVCNNWFKQSDVEVDHIISVGSLKEYTHLPEFVERLFVSEDKLRVVCKPCHKTITKEARDVNV